MHLKGFLSLKKKLDRLNEKNSSQWKTQQKQKKRVEKSQSDRSWTNSSFVAPPRQLSCRNSLPTLAVYLPCHQVERMEMDHGWKSPIHEHHRKTNKPLAPLHEQDVSGFSVFISCSIVSYLRILGPSNGRVNGPVFCRGVLVFKLATVEGSGFLGQLQDSVSFIALTAHRIHLW